MKRPGSADPYEMSDSELLDEIAASDNPDEVIALRAVAAQRGLRNAALDLPFTERLRIAQEQGMAYLPHG